jgi:hypothetical protein
MNSWPRQQQRSWKYQKRQDRTTAAKISSVEAVIFLWSELAKAGIDFSPVQADLRRFQERCSRNERMNGTVKSRPSAAAAGADVLATLDAKRPGPVAARDIEQVLEQGGDAPVLAGACRASATGAWKLPGWLRTRRAPNLQLAVELTEPGRGMQNALPGRERELKRHDNG